MLSVALGIILISLALYLVHNARKANKYWEERGLKHLKPWLFFGNTLPVMLNMKHTSEIFVDISKEFPDEDLVGFYETTKPQLIVQNAELIQKVLIKDFAYFPDHGVVEPDEKKFPIDAYQLFTMNGLKWKAFRSKVSPLFTTGKLKSMYESFQICGDKLINYLDKGPKKDVVLRDAMHLYTLELVGLSVFGFDGKVFENPDSEFRKKGTDIFDSSYLKLIFLTVFPELSKKLGVTFNKRETIDYFCKIIKDAFDYRMEKGIQRNDFIQMMIQLKEKGKIEIQKWDPNDEYLKLDEEAAESFEITDISLMSQAYTFMTTGLDAVSISLSFALYELSLHQEVQNKVREEIREQVKLNSGLTYNALKSATYLENVINEVLRLHPLSIAIFRVCTKKYTFPNGYTVNPGETVYIPVLATHLNPNYHSDPLAFKPERFDYPLKPGTYFPFGDGPRICIAMRFAFLQMKFALATTLLHYKIKLSPKVKLPLKLKPKAIIAEPVQTLYFDIEKVQSN